MHIAIPLLTAFIGGFVSAAPAYTEPETCVVPEVFFRSFPEPFTLSVLLPGRPISGQQVSWPLQLSPRTPSEETESEPFISQTKILPPSFRLVNGTLVTAEGGFSAELGPVIAIFPPPLQPFFFGGPPADSPPQFGAVYACDNTGRQYLKLVTGPAEGFAVNKVAEGERVFIKPAEFVGEAVDASLEIKGGQ